MASIILHTQMGCFTFQKDIDEARLGEVFALMTKDPNSPTLHVMSWNNLRAMTAQADRPWWTVRDKDGGLVGCVQVTQIGDSYSRLANFFVSPEYRLQGIGLKLFELATMDLGCKAGERALQMYSRHHVTKGISSKFFPEQSVESYIHLAFGVPQNPTIRDTIQWDDKFQIVSFARGRLFDKLVHYDTSRIHQLQRKEFLAVFFDEKATTGYVALNGKDEVVGYGGIQTAHSGTSQIVAPLYAEDPSIARVLLVHLMRHYVQGNKVAVFFIEQGRDFVDEIGISAIEAVDNAHVYFAHPDQFKKSVFFLTSCGLYFY